GRGTGSGHGKTAGRGQKGQGARSGGKKEPWFEGGQTPLHRRLPKRGFNNPFRRESAIVNLDTIARFEPGETVTPGLRGQRGIVKGSGRKVKVLGDGELTHPLQVYAHAFSKAAAEKIRAAGGTAELLTS